MRILTNIADGLRNVVANLGTARDKAAHTQYVDTMYDPQELLTTYAVSWVARAGVDLPAEDSVRKSTPARATQLTAQSWWLLRDRFKITHEAVTEGKPFNVDDIIVIRKGMAQQNNLITELSQPTYKRSSRGKIQINKAPDGTKSPNLADSAMMAFAVTKKEGYSWSGFL